MLCVQLHVYVICTIAPPLVTDVTPSTFVTEDSDDFAISWLVQNHLYTSSNSILYFILDLCT